MFQLLKQSKKSRARLGLLTTPHGSIETPFFMPIATKGSVKALDSSDIKALSAPIILANTYHLYLQPGLEVLKKFGGLHKFMGWDGPILTDSGGYQVFSLGNKFNHRSSIVIPDLIGNPEKNRNKKELDPRVSPALAGSPEPARNASHSDAGGDDNVLNSLVKINQSGVEFRSFIDGSKHLFTPEKVQKIQDIIGADIKMVLDICSPHPCFKHQAELDLQLTHEWAKRALEYHQKHYCRGRACLRPGNLKGCPYPSLFGIVQGSIYKDLRIKSAKFLSSLDFDGLAIGGLAVGEDNKKMYQVLDYTIPELPTDKPRYLMGVGKPENIIEAVKRGVDMFDCVIPTREARHGRLYLYKKSNIKNKKLNANFYEVVNILNSKYKKDTKPLDKNCDCKLCQNYSAGYLHHLFKAGEPLALRLATLHNVSFYLKLMKSIRTNIKTNRF
ncbi:MAG TPA: tRNA guanosine(34) transglycosylase Tgt [Patescibacteria group bacterium]|nr:tRNA guanosine(34) transglycosylase Tgt [Patescibacteria group bacterium]